MNCGSYSGVKLLEHGIKTIEGVLEGRIRALVDFDEAQFGFMPGKPTTNPLLLVRRLKKIIKRKTNECTCVLLIWKKRFTKYQEE